VLNNSSRMTFVGDPHYTCMLALRENVEVGRRHSTQSSMARTNLSPRMRLPNPDLCNMLDWIEYTIF
jgi:hypothetical protein